MVPIPIDFDYVAACLLDIDGSCRDLNFEGPTWDGVRQMWACFADLFDDVAALSADRGEPLATPFTDNNVAQFSAMLQRGRGLFSTLQLYVFKEADGTPFVELTLFPEYLAATENLGRDFVGWLRETMLLLEAHQAYARYEDASWQLGDTSPGSGVFLVIGR